MQNEIALQKGIKYSWRLVASIAAVVTLIFTTVGSASVLAWHETTEVQTFPVAQVQSLTVVTRNGGITISGADTDMVRVESSVSASFTDVQPRTELVDGRLTVVGDCPHVFPSLGCEVDYTVVVPHGLAVELRNDAGNLVVSSLTGPLDIDAGRSSVNLTDIAGPTRLKVNHSSVRGTGFSPATATFDASFTDLNIRYTQAPTELTLNSSTSHATVAVPHADGGYRVTSKSEMGDVEVHVAENPASNRLVQLSAERAVARILYSD